MSAQVIPLEPKSKQGVRHGVAWLVSYDMKTKKFKWTVTVTVKPQVFCGESVSMKDAEKEVDALLSNFK